MRKHITVLLATALLAITLLTACQPTPEEAVVVPGGDFEQKMQETDAPFSQYEAPETWQETVELKGSDEKIHIDAEVTVPDVEAVPIYSASQSTLSAEQIEKMAGHFSDEFFYVPELTKGEIEELLIISKQLNDTELIEKYERMLPDAPVSVPTIKIDDWTPISELLTRGYYDMDGDYFLTIFSDDGFVCSGGEIFTNLILEINDMELVEELSISQDEATSVATRTIESMGLNMSVIDIQKGAIYPYTSKHGYSNYDEERKEGYFLEFSQSVAGVSAVVDNGLSLSQTEVVDYTAPFYPTTARMFVEDSGEILHIELQNPISIEEIKIKNVQLLPFDNVTERLKDLMIFSNSNATRFPVHVTDVSLRMSVTNVKDFPEEYIYIPTWVAEYYTDYEGVQGQTETMLVNAIDGGRVIEVPIPDYDM